MASSWREEGGVRPPKERRRHPTLLGSFDVAPSSPHRHNDRGPPPRHVDRGSPLRSAAPATFSAVGPPILPRHKRSAAQVRQSRPLRPQGAAAALHT